MDKKYIVYRKNDEYQIKCDNYNISDIGVWIYCNNEPDVFIPLSNIMQIVDYNNIVSQSCQNCTSYFNGYCKHLSNIQEDDCGNTSNMQVKNDFRCNRYNYNAGIPTF